MTEQVPEISRNILNQICRDQLKDINILSPRIDQRISDKVDSFMEQSGNQPYAHMNEGYIVVVKFKGEAEATDLIIDYIKKKTELMY